MKYEPLCAWWAPVPLDDVLVPRVQCLLPDSDQPQMVVASKSQFPMRTHELDCIDPGGVVSQVFEQVPEQFVDPVLLLNRPAAH